jgi:uncharacterized membrane protein required for colicin V production
MRLDLLPTVTWVDAVIAMLLLLGFRRGLTRGISEEFLDLLKWLTGLLIAAYVYLPLGQFLAEHATLLSRHFCYLTVYVAVLVMVRFFFSSLHQRFGDKLLSSDIFGKGEYVLGTVAGVCRYACIVLVLLALFHGRYYTQEDIRAQIVAQEGLFGSAPFPTVGAVQKEVFEDSWFGATARQYLPMFLIQPTIVEENHFFQAGIAHAREAEIYQILENH